MTAQKKRAPGRPRQNKSAQDRRNSKLKSVNKREREEWQQARDIEEQYQEFQKGCPRNAARHEKCRNDFKAFCESYFREAFCIEWSPDHLKVISKIERAVLHGGTFAMAMPRGSGKSTLCEAACHWAILYGHRRFVALIAATESAAADMLADMRQSYEENDILASDFPGSIFPIRALEGIAHRAKGQLWRGSRTKISWKATQVCMPLGPEGIPGSDGCGSTIRIAGLTGRVRGMKRTGADGEVQRPDMVILDDPQTDDSADSPVQSAQREAILAGAILGLGGPKTKIAAVMPCTIIRPDDMADRILNKKVHPEWNGEVTKMVYRWPVNQKLWDQYALLWSKGVSSDRQNIEEATEFYRKNRTAMDEGSAVSWEHRFIDGVELSAIQHAWNLRLDRKEAAFFAEFQNEPIAQDDEEEQDLTPELLATKCNSYDRQQLADNASTITAFIDIQQSSLWYVVCSFSDRFDTYVMDYGVWPEQGINYFTLKQVRRSLQREFPDVGLESQIYQGLAKLIDVMASATYKRGDGSAQRIDRILIDANWSQSTDVVYNLCRQSSHANLVMPAHGRFYGASSMPLTDKRKERGERRGLEWKVSPAKRRIRSLTFDSNFWKSFCAARWMVPIGDPSGITVFGKDQHLHRMFFDHILSEFRQRLENKKTGRKVDEWKLRPGRDNHWLDGLVGCAVAASMQGCSLVIDGEKMSSAAGFRNKPREKPDWKAAQAEKRKKRG